MGYRVSIASMWVAMLLAIVAAQQPQQGATQENTQPGRDWATITARAESLQIRHHAAVGLVDRCERSGLVVRSPDPRDRRFRARDASEPAGPARL